MPTIQYVTPKEFQNMVQTTKHDDLPTNVGVRIYPPSQVKAFNEKARTVDFIISTGSVDRDNDTIDPKGWDLKSFKSNPVVLWAHDYASLPIGKAVKIGKVDGGLRARAEFVEADLNPMAETVFQMIGKGFLSATSVGFKPREFNENTERKYGLDFSKQELLEFSVVPVPSNPEALILNTLKGAGIDTLPLVAWAESILDSWNDENDLWFERKNLESLAVTKAVVVPEFDIDKWVDDEEIKADEHEGCDHDADLCLESEAQADDKKPEEEGEEKPEEGKALTVVSDDTFVIDFDEPEVWVCSYEEDEPEGEYFLIDEHEAEIAVKEFITGHVLRAYQETITACTGKIF